MSSLVDVLNRFHIESVGPPHRHCRTGWRAVDCIYCSPGSHKFHLGFELATNRVNCWRCGIQFGPKVFQDLFRISEKEARSLWYSLPRTIAPREEIKSKHPLQNPAGIDDLLPAHRRYLEGRGFDVDSLVKTWGIKGIGLATRLQWRIFIPIFDHLGRQVSWTTRSIAKDAEIRYQSASEEEESVSHKSILYGCHLASHVIIINEGPLDAWAFGPGGVATLGLLYSESQLAAMVQHPVRVVCFDSETPAQRRADRLCTQLAAFPGETENVVLETGKDAASADVTEILKIKTMFGL